MFASLSILIGGLGLLLMGMSLMTDGLKLAAGNTLRDILALWTNSRIRGLFSGFLITGIVQSSSAVTVATIGFANAGMLSLERAIWVIFGSNVGTTMTAWIVALIGFQFNIEALALPLIGIGAILKLTGAQARRASLGLALVGFGLLFMGIDTLKTAFDTFGGNYSIPDIDSMSVLAVVGYAGIGFLLTTLMQSSSAAMVVTLSAASGGLIPLNAAAAIVIGANLGTTTTAIITVFGATPTAKRVALGHVFFNIITALVAILILSPMLGLGSFIQNRFGLGSSPAVSLALFHTTFNILGVLLMWPISISLVKLLYTFFRSDEETESKPQFLDRNVLALPYIAVDALTLEISRIARMSIQLLQESLRAESATGISTHRVVVIHNLAREVGSFAANLSKTELTPFLSEALLSLMHATQEYMLSVEIAGDIAVLGEMPVRYRDSDFSDELDAFIMAADRHLDSLTPDNTPEAINSPDSYKLVEETYATFKQVILMNTSFGKLDIADMDDLLQYANQIKRGCRHLWKGARRLNVVRESLQRNPDNQVYESRVTDTDNIAILQDTAQTLSAENEATRTESA